MHPPRGDWRTNQRAKHLRSSMSPPEGILWSRIRKEQLGGLRFRRQRPLGPYVLDFYCVESRLCIEIDGQCHAGKQSRDASRDGYLRSVGVETLRFTVPDIMTNMDGVLATILRRARDRIDRGAPGQ